MPKQQDEQWWQSHIGPSGFTIIEKGDIVLRPHDEVHKIVETLNSLEQENAELWKRAEQAGADFVTLREAKEAENADLRQKRDTARHAKGLAQGERDDLRRQLAEAREKYNLVTAFGSYQERAEQAEGNLAAAREHTRVLAALLKGHCRYCDRGGAHPRNKDGDVCELLDEERAALAAYKASESCTCYKPFGGAHQADCPLYSDVSK